MSWNAYKFKKLLTHSQTRILDRFKMFWCFLSSRAIIHLACCSNLLKFNHVISSNLWQHKCFVSCISALFWGYNKSSWEKGWRQTSIGKHCEDQELRYCGMHFFLHHFTKTNTFISFFSGFHLIKILIN